MNHRTTGVGIHPSQYAPDSMIKAPLAIQFCLLLSDERAHFPRDLDRQAPGTALRVALSEIRRSREWWEVVRCVINVPFVNQCADTARIARGPRVLEDNERKLRLHSLS